MTDSAYLLALLEESPQTTNDVLRRSFHERGVGMTVHSRAADLRRQGHDVRCERVGEHRGRGVWMYELVQHPVQLELAS